MFGLRAPEQPTPAAESGRAAPVEPIQPLGGAAESIAIPLLDQSDPIVRELVRKLSSHSRVTAWLATDGLIRNFTYVVANVADGRTPANLVRPLRPSTGFRVTERGEELSMNPQSGTRYTPLAQAVASIDAAGAAQLYSTLKARIGDAYDEIAEPGTMFDATLERAIVLLLKTPIPEEPFRLVPKGIGYAFADVKLEGLAPAQKLLLRMGPENARIIQTKLRAIAMALGIPARRLP